MADAVTTQILENGLRNWGFAFTNLSDGTGESAVVKVDGSSAGPLGVTVGGVVTYPTKHLKITEIEYDVKGMALEIIWDATTPQNVMVLGGFGKINFKPYGGVAQVDSAGAYIVGATGKIKFTTLGAMPNSGYTVIMRGTKGVPQS